MVQAVQDDDLAEDPTRGVDGLERVRDSLQRDDAPGASIERFAHRAERSAAEEGEEPVPGPDLPRVDVSGVLVLRASRGTERGSSGTGNEGREGRRSGFVRVCANFRTVTTSRWALGSGQPERGF